MSDLDTATDLDMTAERGPAGLSPRQIRLVFVGLMLGMLLAALDQTIVATALPTIVGDLGGLNHLSWVVTSYLLASTVSTPLWGKLGDLYGRKGFFQAAIVIFLIGSALSGLSQNLNELIAFRAIQGLGAGGLIVGAQAIIGDIVPPRDRGRYTGLIGAVFAVASVAGPLLGGFFTDSLSLALGVLHQPADRRDRAGRRRRGAARQDDARSSTTSTTSARASCPARSSR